MRVLLMEDDPVLGDILTDYLQKYYFVDRVFESAEAMRYIDDISYDLMILDINVPGQSGIELLRDLRSYDDTTPAIIITAYADTRHLKDSFDAGAHDYIRKPFELEELRLRIEKSKVLFAIEQEQIVWLSKDISYDASRRVVSRGGQKSSLKPKEAQILDYFLSHSSRVISTDELIQNIWRYDTIPTDATIRSQIRNLREIIGAERIVTLRGVGYCYE